MFINLVPPILKLGTFSQEGDGLVAQRFSSAVRARRRPTRRGLRFGKVPPSREMTTDVGPRNHLADEQPPGSTDFGAWYYPTDSKKTCKGPLKVANVSIQL